MSLINREALLGLLEEQERIWRATNSSHHSRTDTARADAAREIIRFIRDDMPAVAITREDVPVAALIADAKAVACLIGTACEQASQAHRKLLAVLEALRGEARPGKAGR